MFPVCFLSLLFWVCIGVCILLNQAKKKTPENTVVVSSGYFFSWLVSGLFTWLLKMADTKNPKISGIFQGCWIASERAFKGLSFPLKAFRAQPRSPVLHGTMFSRWQFPSCKHSLPPQLRLVLVAIQFKPGSCCSLVYIVPIWYNGAKRNRVSKYFLNLNTKLVLQFGNISNDIYWWKYFTHLSNYL